MKLKKYAPALPYFVFVVALLSTVASLFFSEFLNITPCILCWYQRIFMYPLVIISAVNIMKKHNDLPFYILPLSVIGFLVAVYHNLLVWRVVPETLAPCRVGVSCVTQHFTLFGFFTIPFGSMLAFALITISMILYAQFEKEKISKASRKVSNK